MSTLEIDGQAIATRSILEFDQSYEDLRSIEFARLADNSGIIRGTGDAKLRTVISGRGWAPPGLVLLNRGESHVIKCAMPNSAIDSTTTVTLPANRRNDTDHDPIGFALVGDELVETPIINLAAINAFSTNDATLQAVTGAEGYLVNVWPEITAAIVSNTSKGVSRGASFEWQIEAEEL